MADELIDLVVAAATDVTIERAAKRHRWARVLRATIGLLFFGLIAALVFITFWYS
jgi:hypothetical protein